MIIEPPDDRGQSPCPAEVDQIAAYTVSLLLTIFRQTFLLHGTLLVL